MNRVLTLVDIGVFLNLFYVISGIYREGGRGLRGCLVIWLNFYIYILPEKDSNVLIYQMRIGLIYFIKYIIDIYIIINCLYL